MQTATNCTTLEELKKCADACNLCEISKNRTQAVFSNKANKPCKIMFIGEAPGFNEDIDGEPFTGESGQMLTRMITNGLKLTRDDIYLANILKCRPPDNREPSPEETANCTPWLDRQIELVDPRIIFTLGNHATKHVLKTKVGISKLRGTIIPQGNRIIAPLYHPAYLLRNPDAKSQFWEDVQRAIAYNEVPVV